MSASVEERLTQVLAGWAAGSVLVGSVLLVPPQSRSFGRQTAGWGAVDGVIALVGVRSRARKGPTAPQRLRRVLLINAGLDVAYVIGGAALVRHGRWPGDGWAVVVQGAFLLCLDGLAAGALWDQVT